MNKKSMAALLVAVWILPTAAHAEKGAHCSEMDMIVTVADVDRCLTTLPAIDKWKSYWMLDEEAQPSFFYKDYPQRIEVRIIGETHMIAPGAPWALLEKNSGYRTRWTKRSSSSILPPLRLFAVMKWGGDMRRFDAGAEGFINRWTFAEDCLTVLENDLSGSPAERMGREESIRKVRNFKGAVDQVAVKTRSLMMQRRSERLGASLP